MSTETNVAVLQIQLESLEWRLGEMTRAAYEWKARAEKAEAERDEARATKDMHKERQEQMVRERDDLRVALGIVRDEPPCLCGGNGRDCDCASAMP